MNIWPLIFAVSRLLPKKPRAMAKCDFRGRDRLWRVRTSLVTEDYFLSHAPIVLLLYCNRFPAAYKPQVTTVAEIFPTTFTRELMGEAFIRSAGYGIKFLIRPQRITKHQDASSEGMTGIRVWISRTNTFGSPVMIVLLFGARIVRIRYRQKYLETRAGSGMA
jgi:hypothetical protein